MYPFAKILSLFKTSSSLPPPDPIPAVLRPGRLTRRPLSIWYTEFINLSSEDHIRLMAFTLVSILHWEQTGRLRHEGLTFVFERDPLSVVYLRVDRMSIDNDAWTCEDYEKSIWPPSSKPSEDQNSSESLSRAVNWCQPLNNEGIFRYFTDPNTNPPSPTSSAHSLGITQFRTTQPNIVNVILAMCAVSKLQPNDNVWEVNCWWLARSIRRFIETEWRGEADIDGPIPPAPFVDRCHQQLLTSLRDQDGICKIYKEFNEILVSFLHL
jgi:hypothetical protein